MERIEKPKNAISSTAGTVKIVSGKGSQFRRQLLGVLGVVFLTTCSALLLERADKALSLPVHSAIFVMPYLLGVVLAALKFDRWASMATATLTVISLVVIFIHPLFEKTPKDFDYLLILAVFLIISAVINELSFTTRKQSALIAETEARMETERLKNTLLRSVSHDLRSPLATIMGAASSLSDDASGLSEDKLRELATSICRESERLDRQVGNLLEMTSLESPTLVLRQDWYSAEDLIGDALTALERRLDGKEIEIEIDKDVPSLFVDGLLIEKVFINLIENCLKYAPDQLYRISASLHDGFAEIEVFNTGVPIAVGEEKRIFEKFYRGAHAEADGAGLGLAICQSIVQLHGGTIGAREELKNGVAIKFRLPVRDDEPHLLLDG